MRDAGCGTGPCLSQFPVLRGVASALGTPTRTAPRPVTTPSRVSSSVLRAFSGSRRADLPTFAAKTPRPLRHNLRERLYSRNMREKQLSALLLIICLVLLCPPGQTRRPSSTGRTADDASAERAKQRPLVAKRSILSCDASFDSYCLNNGQCMFLVDLNENHCQCELGYLGSRCEQPQLVRKPMKEEELALVVVCVVLLVLGLAGALYLFCEWYRKKHLPHQQKRPRDSGVQIA